MALTCALCPADDGWFLIARGAKVFGAVGFVNGLVAGYIVHATPFTSAISTALQYGSHSAAVLGAWRCAPGVRRARLTAAVRLQPTSTR